MSDRIAARPPECATHSKSEMTQGRILRPVGWIVQAVDVARSLRRDVAAHHIGMHARSIALARIAEPAAAAGADANAIAGVEHQCFLERLLRGAVGAFDQDVARRAVTAAVESPGGA